MKNNIQRIMLWYVYHFRVLKKGLAQKKTKVIVVMRNPKDQLVSWYHMHTIFKDLKREMSWDTFFEVSRK